MTDERSPPGSSGAEQPTPDTNRPTLHAKGVFYPGEKPGTTEFSGALFDGQGRVLARHVHAELPSFVLSPMRRGRPPKDVRAALALVAAFDAAECRQLSERGSSKKNVSREALGYADDRSAREALKTAHQKIERLLPKMNWEALCLPDDPFDHGDLGMLELAERGLAAIWMTGDGASPRLGETWTGRAIAVFLPVDFKPREKKEVALVRGVEQIYLKP